MFPNLPMKRPVVFLMMAANGLQKSLEFTMTVRFELSVILMFSTFKEQAREALEIFDELVECDVSIVVPHIKAIVEFCLQVRCILFAGTHWGISQIQPWSGTS
jgi:hypothetical protein